METFGMILLAISLSIDAFGIGLAYSLRKINIPLLSKIIISVISVIMTGISFIIGSAILLFISDKVAKIIGCAMLVLLGIVTIYKGLKQSDNEWDNISNTENKVKSFFIKPLSLTVQIIKKPKKRNLDRTNSVNLFESIYLGISLSLDSLVVGISYAIIGGLSLLIPFYVGLGQFIFLSLGSIIGRKIIALDWINPKIFIFISGFILIFLAIIRIL